MISILDTHEARQTVFPVSVEFYHEAGRLGLIGEDVELLEGVLFKKMAKSPLHQFLARKLQRLLESLLPPGFFVDRECPITCSRSEPEPDVAVFAGTIEDYEHAHPTSAELVIEIAISTQQRDRSKAAIYAEAGVKEYWLVEPDSRSVVLYQVPGAAGYGSQTTFSADQEVRSSIFPAFVLQLGTLLA
ncbi:MAG: Uma2 family endonuclease [Prosthecobacter sp.]|nr:Uma2 family endonuclease [Prosthecobacter sp.]